MKRRVFSKCHHFQVFWSIVKRVVIDMMDNFSGKQLAPNLSFCDNSMFVFPAPRCVNLNHAVHKSATVMESRGADWVGDPDSVNALSSALCDFRRRCVLTFGATLGVVERLASCPSDFGNRLSAGCTWLGGKLFRHAIMYTNFIRSASCQ